MKRVLWLKNEIHDFLVYGLITNNTIVQRKHLNINRRPETTSSLWVGIVSVVLQLIQNIYVR